MIDSASLLRGVEELRHRVDAYKVQARVFYLEVLLSQYACPQCGRALRPRGASACQCIGGHTWDPTIEFASSPCCGAKVRRARCHYVCTNCGTALRSPFLFDERLLDAQYFCEKMAECRERKRRRKEELRLFLAASRSSDLCLTEMPHTKNVEELSRDLDVFVDSTAEAGRYDPREDDEFRPEEYRRVILATLDACSIRFSALPCICSDLRLDRARRFMTLLFMEQDREVWLEQRGQDILVVPYEVDVQG